MKATIEVFGLKETMSALRSIDTRIPGEVKAEIKRIVQPVVASARGYASALGGSGDYAASFSVRNIKDGVRILSSDEAAGVIEFANPGAVARRGKRTGKPVGVPRRGLPARAIVKARDEQEPAIIQAISDHLNAVIEGYLHG